MNLLSCPFCGSPAVICKENNDPELNYFYIRCVECGARTDGAYSEKNAILEWNRRNFPNTQDGWKELFSEFVDLMHKKSDKRSSK